MTPLTRPPVADNGCSVDETGIGGTPVVIKPVETGTPVDIKPVFGCRVVGTPVVSSVEVIVG